MENVTFPWINVSGCNFNIMNTLHEFAAKPARCWKWLKLQFQGCLLKLTKSIQSRCVYNWCLIRVKSLSLPKSGFPTLHLSCSPYLLLPKSTQSLNLSSLAYWSHVYNRIAYLKSLHSSIWNVFNAFPRLLITTIILETIKL